MKNIKKIKDCLTHYAVKELDNIENIDIIEFEKVVDMIKDLSKSIYYCSISEAMEDEDSKAREYYRNKYDKMYYEDENLEWDMWKGNSPEYRKMYMKSKETHQEKDKQMKELEKYLKELNNDIHEMVTNSSPEEKEMVIHKLTDLINQMH